MHSLVTPTEAFCEARLFNGCPEILNTLSSLIYCVIAYVGFKNSVKYQNIFEITLIYTCMFILGMGSATYHYTCITFGKGFDESAMIILTIIIMIFYITSLNMNHIVIFCYSVAVAMYYIILLVVNILLFDKLIFVIGYTLPIIIYLIMS